MRFSDVVGLKFDLIVDGAYTYAASYSILGKNYDMGLVPGPSSQSRRNDLFGTRHRHQTPAL